MDFFPPRLELACQCRARAKTSFSKFQNERKQVKSSLSAVQPTEILGYDSST